MDDLFDRQRRTLEAKATHARAGHQLAAADPGYREQVLATVRGFVARPTSAADLVWGALYGVHLPDDPTIERRAVLLDRLLATTTSISEALAEAEAAWASFGRPPDLDSVLSSHPHAGVYASSSLKTFRTSSATPRG